MALIHHQFESIHPYYDGNGRTGRILNVLYLILNGIQDVPILYLSRYIINNKADYYRLLREVKEHGNWEEWLIYMIQGVTQTARETIELIEDMKEQMQQMKQLLRSNYRFYSHDLLNNLFKYPYTKIEFVMDDLGVSRGTASVRAEIEMNPSILGSECAATASVAAAFRAFAPSAPLSFELRTFYTGRDGNPHELFAILVNAEWGSHSAAVPSHMLHMIGPSEWYYHTNGDRPKFNPTRNIGMGRGDIFLHSEPRQPGYQYPCGPHDYTITPSTRSFGICVNGAIYGRGDKCMDGLVVGRLKDATGVIKALLGSCHFRYS